MTRAQWEELLRREGESWNGTPFVWKASTRRGADCRGIIVGCLGATGITIPKDDGHVWETHWFLHDRGRNRYLEALLQIGREVPAPAPGDILAFWSTKHDKVVHSGLLIDDRRILHAKYKVGGTLSLLSDPQFRQQRVTFVRARAIEEHLGELEHV